MASIEAAEIIPRSGVSVTRSNPSIIRCLATAVDEQKIPVRFPKCCDVRRTEIAPGLPTWESWFEAANVKGRVPQGGPRFESLHLALTAAQRGQGIALGLTPLIDEDVAAGNLVRPFHIAVKSRFSFWLVLKPERARERKIATFREWLHQETHRA